MHSAVRLHHGLCHLAFGLGQQRIALSLGIDHLEHHVDDKDLNDRANAEAEDHLDDEYDIELSIGFLVDPWLLVFDVDRRSDRHLRAVCEEERDHEAHSLAPVVEVDCLLSHDLLDPAD